MKSIEAGSRLGPYEILSPLGAGGMGEVYRARDMNLGREVALKILPDAFASDPDRVARFEREARVLASLNHPNIAAIHGLERADGKSFLIMELAPGETLAARIARGRVPVDDALPIAAQIAAALGAAHEKGVVHRDLKPANISLAPDGKIKVLDFGLAKPLANETRAINVSQSPTMAQGPTSDGMILGTAAYMSPEQARGKGVDKRTDIWAFGCVLYEMLTGKAAFAGETLTDIVAAVVTNDPDWSLLPVATPDGVRSVLRRCLKKDPIHRFHDAGDARIEIEEAEEAAPAVSSPPTSRLWLVTVASGTVAVLAVAWMVATRVAPGTDGSAAPVVRLELNLPPGAELPSANTPNIAISPDGSLIAFTGGIDGLRQLYVRRIDEFEARPLRSTETVNVCAFSPDGRALVFITSDRVLKKITLADSLVTTLIGEVDYSAGAAVWGTDDIITFGRNGTLWQIPAGGGTARQITTLDGAKNERLHIYPTLVAGGKAVLFESVTEGSRTETHIEALSLSSGNRHRVVDEGRSPTFTSSNHLVYFRDGAIVAVPFDPLRLETAGPAAAVLQDISLDQLGNPVIAISQKGWLAYQPTANATRRLVWVSRQGVEQPISDTSRPYQSPRLAPDSRRIVIEIAGGNLWVLDTTRKTFSRLTLGETVGNTNAVWQPDGKGLVFRTLTGLRWIDPNGEASRAIPGTSVADIPSSISPDGQTMLFVRQSSEAGGDVYALSLHGDAQPQPVIKTPGYDGGAQFSPDGKWLAYASNESGQFQVYLRTYSGTDRTVPVSTEGGTHPKWNPNGKELFYRKGNKMMAVDVVTSPSLKLSEPRVLFEQRYAFGSAQTVANYDVTPDGQRFVMVKDDAASARINLVLNWFEELKRLAPTQAR